MVAMVVAPPTIYPDLLGGGYAGGQQQNRTGQVQELHSRSQEAAAFGEIVNPPPPTQ